MARRGRFRYFRKHRTVAQDEGHGVQPGRAGGEAGPQRLLERRCLQCVLLLLPVVWVCLRP